jgi:hypothetical protein
MMDGVVFGQSKKEREAVSTKTSSARAVPGNTKKGNTEKGNTEKGNTEKGNTEKDPSERVTGDETMTGAQASYLKTLCEEAGAAFDPDLTKAEASTRITQLQAKTGRGRDH